MKPFWAFVNRSVINGLMGLWDLFTWGRDYPAWMNRFDDWSADKAGFLHRSNLRVFILGPDTTVEEAEELEERLMDLAGCAFDVDLILPPGSRVEEYMITEDERVKLDSVTPVYEKIALAELVVTAPDGSSQYRVMRRGETMDLPLDVKAGALTVSGTYRVSLN